MTAQINPDEIKRALSLIHNPGDTFEIRIPGPDNSTISKMFSDIGGALTLIQKEDKKNPKGIYVTLNPITKKADTSAHDEDILTRRWFLIDIDPKRPTNTSSTDEAHQAAIEKICRVKDFLSEYGWSDPVLCDSGNGAHLLYKIDLPNDESSKILLQSCLNVLKGLFSDSFSNVDTSVFNASRISKIYGTVARKGVDTLERPHRTAKIIHVPDNLEIVSINLLKELSSISIKEESTQDKKQENTRGKKRRQVTTGEIDNYLTSQAGLLFNDNLRDMDLFNALSLINQEDCDPPAEDSDLKRIWASALRNFSMPGKKSISKYRDLPERELTNTLDDLKLTIDLPADNFISRFVSFGTEKTDAYPDYHYGAALFLLSVIADHHISIPLRHEITELYANIWIQILGKSSFSRKSTSLNPVKIILGAYPDEFKQMADTITPERFVELLDVHSHRYHVKDEAGSIYGDLNGKKFYEGLRHYLCQAYDGQDITRENKARKNEKTIWHARKPYLSCLWATTGEAFMQNTSPDDVHFGLLYRFLIIDPKYPKENKPVSVWRKGDKRPEIDIGKIGEMFFDIFHTLRGMSGVRAIPSKEGMDLYNEWLKRKQMEYDQESEEVGSVKLGILARISPMVFKLAVLFTIGDYKLLEKFSIDNGLDKQEVKPDYPVKGEDVHPDRAINQDNQNTLELTIPDDYLKKSILVIDEYFILTAIERFNSILSRGERNTQEAEQTRILDIIKSTKKKEISRSELLKKSKFLSKKLDEHLDTLIDSETIEMGFTGEGNKKTLTIRLL